MKYIEALVDKINRLEGRLFVFLILCGNILSFTLNSNEELHLQFAKHYVDPNWIANSVTLTDWPGYRFILNYLLGFLLQHFNFAATVFIGRLITVLLMVVPLSRLFKKLNLSNVDVLLVIQSFIFFGQSFFGGEWIFGGIEPKTLAYPFVFLALYYLLEDKPYRTCLSLVAATYCHVLVGAWVFVLFGLYLLISKQKIATILATSSLYVAAMSPFFYYLLHELVVNNQSIVDGIDIDWVIVYYRSPHHFGPFLSPTFFFLQFLLGVLFSVAAAVICFFVFKNQTGDAFRKLNVLAIIATVLLWPFLLVAYFDKHGHIMKFHPFRLSTLSLFLFILLLVVYVRKTLLNHAHESRYVAIVFLLSFTLFGYAAMTHAGVMYLAVVNPVRPLDELAAYARANTRPDDVFVLLFPEDDLDFTRKAEREVFAINKFFPNTPKLIGAWYLRMLEQQRMLKDMGALKQALEHYRIDYVVSKIAQYQPQLQEVYKNNEFYVYKVRPLTSETQPDRK